MTTPDLSQVIRLAIEAELAEIRVSLPGKIITYDAGAGTADIEITIENPLDEETSESFPIVRSVPVVFPRATVGGWYMHFPLTTGDEGDLIFADWPIDAWRRNGETRAPVDLRNHSIGGAKFYPGLHSANNTISDVEPSAITLGKDGVMKISIDSNRMIVGGASDAAALASKVSDLETLFSNHSHAFTSPSGPVGAVTPPVVAANYASDKLKLGG